MMTGIKDPTEQPKTVEKTNQGNEQNNVVIKADIADFKAQPIQSFIDLSREMAETYRSFLKDLKAKFEELREQQQSILDLFSLEKWTQPKQ